MSHVKDPGRDEPMDEQTDLASAGIRAVIEHHDGDNECTLYPNDADDVTLMSRWITASEGSYVALAEMR